jgi:hypothetical protein
MAPLSVFSRTDYSYSGIILTAASVPRTVFMAAVPAASAVCCMFIIAVIAAGAALAVYELCLIHASAFWAGDLVSVLSALRAGLLFIFLRSPGTQILVFS